MTLKGRRPVHLWISFFMLVCSLAVSSLVRAEAFKVGTWKTAQTIQPFYYEQFTPASDSVSVFTFTNPADQKVALLAGSLDMCGTTLAHAIHSASRGEPVVVVAAMCNKCSALVVRKDGPVQTVKDLRGKKVGYVPGTMHEILLREALKQNGLNADHDVRLMRVDFFDMGLALAGGSIDAFLSGEPFPSLAVDQGYGRILSHPYYDESIGSINAAILVSEENMRKDPGRLYTLVLAHARATAYLEAHPDVWLKKASTFGTPLAVLREAAKNMELAWELDETFIQRTRMLAKRMQDLGLIDHQPDFNRLFDLSLVKRVKANLK